MLKKLLKPDMTSGFLKAMNTTRIKLGRIRSSLYGEPLSEFVSHQSAVPARPDNEIHLAQSIQSERKLFFFHAMKTGGVTFRRILSSIYGNSFQICYDPTSEAIESSLANTAAMEFHTFHFKGRLAHMHTGLTTGNHWDILEGRDCFTLLREPVDHVVSFYYHMVRRRMFIEPLYNANGWHFPDTLEEFLDDEFHFNTQTGFFADNSREGVSAPPGVADLDRAKATFTRLKMHVGLTERFSDSMNIFEHVTGLQIPGGVIHNENRNRSRLPLESISQRLRDRIREHSGLDNELYQFGREMFLEDLSQCSVRRTYTFEESERGDQAVMEATASRAVTPVLKPVAVETTASQSATGPKVVYFHNLNAGGVALRRILKSVYEDKFHAVENPAIESVAQSLKSFDCIEFNTQSIHGNPIQMHFNLAKKGRWDVLAGSHVFTMFRDPVDQVVEQYFELQARRQTMEPVYRAWGMKFPGTIEEYLDNPIHLNNQLAFFIGKQLTPSNPELTSTDLNNVKKMLIQLNVHPGLPERFAESIHIFETITGRRVPRGEVVSQNDNLSKQRLGEISVRTKDRIRDLSGLDNVLYLFAFDLFMKDISQCGRTRQYKFLDMSAPVLATA